MGYQVDMSPLTQSGINQANMLQGLGQTIGGAIGGYQRRGEQEQKQAQMQQLMQAAASGDPQAIEMLYSIDPQAGKAMEQRLFTGQDRAQEQSEDRFKTPKAFATAKLIEKMSYMDEAQQEAAFNAAEKSPDYDIDESDRPLFKNRNSQRAAVQKVMGEDYANNVFGVSRESQNIPAASVEFQNLLDIAQDPNATQLERDSARRKLGDLASVSGGVAKTVDVGGVPHIFDPVRQTLVPMSLGGEEVTPSTVGQSKASIAGDVTTAEEDVKVSADLRKQTQRQNNQRISELTKDEKSRASTSKKASRFLKAFKSSAKSGASRSALSFLPGVFTDQAQFDEEFNAFAEVAARAKLKASGETRPTDSDVEGMKRAIFGLGRDEQTNINLLQEFIDDISNADLELDELRDAKSRGRLDVYTGARERSEADILAEYGVE